MNRSKWSIRRPRFYYGWVVVIVAALGGFSASTETYPVLSIFLKPITGEFGWTRAAFTGPLTIGGILGSLAAIVTGPLVDKFGPRWALAGAYTVLGISFVLMSLIGNLGQFYGVQIVARSMNTGVLAVASAVIVPNWFIIKRGRATALSALGFPAGAAVMPLLIQAIIAGANWRLASIAAGIIIVAVSALPTALFLRRRPEDIGLLPDGAAHQNGDVTPTHDLRITRDEPSLRLGEAARHPALYLLTAAVSLWWFGRTGVALHAVPYMTDQGISDNLAVMALVVHSAIGAVGSIVAGLLRDRTSVRLLIAVNFFLNGAAFVMLLFVSSPLTAMAWAVFYGFAQGGSVTLQRLAFADYFGRRHLGSIEGVVRAVTNVTQAAGPLAAALAFDITGHYRTIFMMFVVTNIMAAFLVWIAKPPAAGNAVV